MPVHEDKFDLLYFEIDGDLVEKVKVFGKSNMEEAIKGLKKSYEYLLSDKANNYLFYIVRQSKLNTFKNISR